MDFILELLAFRTLLRREVLAADSKVTSEFMEFVLLRRLLEYRDLYTKTLRLIISIRVHRIFEALN